jgi:hypothetical protein
MKLSHAIVTLLLINLTLGLIADYMIYNGAKSTNTAKTFGIWKFTPIKRTIPRVTTPT